MVQVMAAPVQSSSRADSECAWNAFVHGHENATLFHDIRWRSVIADALGCRSYYLEAWESARLAGVLPLFLVRVSPFKSALVSIPFLNYGGPLADTETARHALLSDAIELAKDLRVEYLELRSREPMDDRFSSLSHKETYEIDLTPGRDAIWRLLKASVRNKVRKASKLGVTVSQGKDLLPEFYRCFSRNMRDLGTPVLGLHFFEQVLRRFPRESHVFVASREGRPVGGKFVMAWRGIMHFIWASSLRQMLSCAPNDLLNWRAIEYACEQQMTRCDFGRSTRESTHAAYKKQWAAVPRPLFWEYYGSGAPRGDSHVRTATRPYRCASLVWRRLPLCIANRLGPPIAKHLP
ncbi:MAG TPA: FemAB family XrtA/PEP-CTERM system-associated protein [Armatimonadota bacterium]|nr:FemAB family XrtA/PEP-CTERM system-associated protein [Armatimonadota bacterium]